MIQAIHAHDFFNDTKIPAAVLYICNGEIVLFFVFRIFDEGRNSM